MKSIAICLFSNKSNIGQAYFSSKSIIVFLMEHSLVRQDPKIDIDLFENRQMAIDFITQHGCCFNQYTKDSLLALPYMLRYGEKEQAENYFNHYIHSSKCRNRFVKAYSQLEKNDVIDCGLDNRFVKLAYSQKLKIK